MGPAVSGAGPLLLIGYGNRLRGDDALGPLVAEAVAAGRAPGVKVVVAHQLTPDLAETLARARGVVFVDASTEVATVSVRPIEPLVPSIAMGHAIEPGVLLGWAVRAFGHAPPAWLLRIPATTFELGAALSNGAEAGRAEAVEVIRAWIESGGKQLATPPNAF